MPSEIENKIIQLKKIIGKESNSEIRLSANGGNSILLVCNPILEIDYIKKAKELLINEEIVFININKLLIDFIDRYKDEIEQKFELLKSEPYQIFKNPEGIEENDFFELILTEIEKILNQNKIPFIFSVGSLYGTGIENIHIIESKIVMNSKLPIIILYPATQKNDKLLFLNSRPSSKYRCMLIN